MQNHYWLIHTNLNKGTILSCYWLHKIYPFYSDKQLERKRSSEDENANIVQVTAARDMEEARQRVLNALKTSFKKQRNDGLISDDAVTVLNQAVNSVQNEHQSTQFVSLNQLKRNWKLFGFLPKVSLYILCFMIYQFHVIV